MRVHGALFAALIATASSFPAAAQTAPQLVKRYTELAGSAENAKSLVNGLHEGSTITLKDGNTVATIQPAARETAFGNVDNALALTQASLKKRGIVHPTPEQLRVALTALLDQRAAGQGWGEIARSLGFSLGEIKDAQDQREQNDPVQQARAEEPARAENSDRPIRPDRPDRSTRPDRPERPQI